MRFMMLFAIHLCMILSLVMPVFAADDVKKSSSGMEELKQYVDELKNHPDDRQLREKIIKAALGIKPPPALTEEVERNMARGAAIAQKASDKTGYQKALIEFEAAANAAPWFALAYYNLGVVQEKMGLFKDAIQSLKFYLLASPSAKNARDVKNKIYALEVDIEDMQAGMNTPAPKETVPVAIGDKHLVVAGKPTLEIEPDKALRIIKMPRDSKAKTLRFEGNWYFKESIRGEDVTIHAFEISKSPNGDLMLIPPKRAADSVAVINIFEINDKSLKLQMKWKMKSVVGYWKTETYELSLSPDGSQLAGSHNQKSVGGRNIDMDRSLYRQ